MRILGWQSDWAVLFQKWGQKFSNSEWRTLSQHDNGVFVASIGWYGYGWRGSSRTAQPVTLRKKQLVVARKISWPCSHAMVIRIGHWRRAIWSSATSFFEGFWNLVSMPANHKQFLSSRWRFDVSMAKLSCNYVEMSSKISSKEQECASRVMGDICRILCSTINRSVFTLYWNKNISTFWINGAFYYKIKSCALVATPFYLIHTISHTETQILVSDITVVNVGLLVGVWDSKWNCCYCNWEVHLKVITRFFKLQIYLKIKIKNQY